MLKTRHRLGDAYSPLYFLSALGAGGLSISFFIYLMFLTPHPATPIPTWNSLQTAFYTDSTASMQALILLAAGGLIVFSLLHIRLLFWNIGEFLHYRRTATYQALRNSNAEVQLMAIPLTFAMSINVGFALGAVFVPDLWNVVEYLFPLALLAFGLTGFFALKLFLSFMSRILTQGSFDCERNNSFSQMLAVFTFAMVGVGFSASAAMSHVKLTSGIAIIFSLMFLTFAVLLGLINLVLGFRAMLQKGIDHEAAVTLWIIIPIITLSGIALYRIGMGMHHNFGVEIDPIKNLALFTVFVSVQILFALIGYAVMKKLGYFEQFVYGPGKSIGSYSLVCPGVAGFVMGFFFIHIGLISTGLVDKFSLAHLLLMMPLVLLQLKTIWTLLRINSKLLKRETLPGTQLVLKA